MRVRLALGAGSRSPGPGRWRRLASSPILSLTGERRLPSCPSAPLVPVPLTLPPALPDPFQAPRRRPQLVCQPGVALHRILAGKPQEGRPHNLLQHMDESESERHVESVHFACAAHSAGRSGRQVAMQTPKHSPRAPRTA